MMQQQQLWQQSLVQEFKEHISRAEQNGKAEYDCP
jgi:hypothetical protein